MPICDYIYCRAQIPEEDNSCPVCGFPREKNLLRDPGFPSSIEVAGLPQEIVDMHQILPAVDGAVEMQLAMMEHFGIRRALIQSAPDEATSLWGNDRLLELATARSPTFWISQYADPRMQNAIDKLGEIADGGVRVVKLLPTAGWQGDDPALNDFWARMEELGLVAMIHTGFITARHKHEERQAGVFMSSRLANPLYFDRPARQFPDLQIILCHCGEAIWFEASAQMVTQHDNVWGDISGFGLFALRRILRLGVTVDWDKLFWGNDSPAFAYPLNLRLLMDTLRREGAEHLVAGLLHDNGQRFATAFLE